jgi:predicted LPLAT superfamily acyltransferase
VSRDPEASAPPAADARRWSARSVAARWQHRFFYALIRLGGRRPAYAFLRLVAGWYILARPGIWGRTRFYLDRRFPGRGWAGRRVDSFRHMVALGEILIDRAAMGILGPQEFSVTHQSRDQLRALLAEGRGLVLVTAHVGCWQVAMRALDLLDRPVHMLMRHEDGDVDRQWYEHAGVERPYRIIDPGGYLGGALELVAALKKGDVVCIMGDRVFGSERQIVRAPFLGAPAAFPLSPYVVAAAAGAPVAVMFSAKTGYRSYGMTVAEVLRPVRRQRDAAADFRGDVERFAAALERYVGEHPMQFFNYHDLWAPAPGGATGREAAGVPGAAREPR